MDAQNRIYRCHDYKKRGQAADSPHLLKCGLIMDTKKCYTLPELSELLGIPQNAVLDLIDDFFTGKDKKERKEYLRKTDIHTL